MEPLPCDWCDDYGVPEVVREGPHVFVECRVCGTRGPSGPGWLAHGRDWAIAAWNRSAPDPLREALLWERSANHRVVHSENGEGMFDAWRMARTAAAEVERLLSAQAVSDIERGV